MQINGIDAKESFQKDFKKAPANVQEAATKAIDDLLKNPQPNKLRLHSLSGCFNPKILKIDVMPNKSWQITFEMDGSTAILRRLGTHKTIDRRP
ncbi:hypothetical protein [Orrella marina]|uniref:Uncharacterized protein n=1 Tax=Orrella marina TaxID=2163011 RepID=A0A2R4XFW9_9BURK|nr:hypothetical protein [Orrella marina]AWB32685.1 hypothetical protein DBV39_01995 [Orrella marina]